VICCTDIENVAAAAEYGASTDAFDEWFKSKVMELCGIDPSKQPEGPPAVTLLDWPLD
jgi:hypothetical protein